MKEEKNCKLCGTPFIANKKSNVFCNIKCADKYRKEVYAKEYREKEENKIKANNYQNRWKEENSEKVRGYEKISWERKKEREKWRVIKCRYGLTKEDYLKILDDQNNRCLICTNILTSPQVDHCHDTGKVRGILCPKCNMGLGSFNDNIEFLYSAINYLKIHK